MKVTITHIPDCYEADCYLCAYLEKLCQVNAKIRVRQLQIDGLERSWSVDDIVQARKNRIVRMYELEVELKILEDEYFKRIAPADPE